jgi:hypothetical protein
MPNRMGNFIATVVIGSLAGIALVIAADGAAADNCLAAPNGAAPKGGHWYYRVDRAAKRNCWYVRAQSATPNGSRNSSMAATSPATEPPLQPALANARAEAGPADVGQPDAAAPPATSGNPDSSTGSSADNAQSAVASRWLDQTGTAGPSTAERTDTSGEPAAPTPAAVDPPAPTTMHPVSPPAAVPTLLLVMIGALAAAAVMAGIIFWFGSRRTEAQGFERDQPAPWDRIDVEPLVPSPAVATVAPEAQAATQRQRREAVIPDEIVQLLSNLSKEAPA